MDTDRLFSEVAEVICRTFDADAAQITRVTTAIDVDGWDSLSHTILILNMEEKFGIKLPAKMIYKVKNVGELADVIAGQLQSKQA